MYPLVRSTTRRPRTTTPDSIESAENDRFRTTAVGIRNKRQIYYLCGNFPNQYLSVTQCNNNGCSSCGNNNCQYRCSSTTQCISIRANWKCINGCCRAASYDPTTTRAPSPSPVCGGRETSGGYCRSGNTCGSGYLCTDNNVCCRCSYGTSVGPCVNGQCPNNTYCSPTNNCCPYLVS